MSSAANLNELPVERAARLVALALLDEVKAARKRMSGRRRDRLALHDFRVAVRRLRTWLRVFRPWLEDTVPRKAERRLKNAARLTSESRDAEVHVEWLRAQRRTMSARQRVGVGWLVARIEKEKVDADRGKARKAMRAVDRARDALLPALAEYRAPVRREGRAKRLCFGSALARLLREHARTLATRLAEVHGVDDDRGVHAARLTAKRLRYLLEPLADGVPDGPGLVTDLASLQDTLGDWHDARVFATAVVEASELAAAAKAHRLSKRVLAGEAPAAAVRAQRHQDVTFGLLALAGRLHERVLRSFAKAEPCLRAGSAVQARIDAVADALEYREKDSREIDRERPRGVVDDSSHAPMAVEVEHGYVPPMLHQ